MSIEVQVYEALTRKRYNRDEPYLKEKLKERFHFFIAHNKPIKLVGFWGVGLKNKPNWADLAACSFLTKLNTDVKEVYSKGIEFTFIFATLHGVHNGINLDMINGYTGEMEKVFRQHGFKFIYLDKLWKKYGINFDKIEKVLKQKEKNWWINIPNHQLLERNARNRNQRLKPKVAAQKYVVMRELEKKMLETEFSGSVFHAFSDSKIRTVFPNLPTLYFHSRKKGSDTPWFITKDKTQHYV